MLCRGLTILINKVTHYCFAGRYIKIIKCRQTYVGKLDILFHQIITFIKVCVAFVFGLQTLHLIDFSKIFLLKDLKPKNKGHTNFCECCELTKKEYSRMNK